MPTTTPSSSPALRMLFRRGRPFRRALAVALGIALSVPVGAVSAGAAQALGPTTSAAQRMAVAPTDPGTFVSLDPARILDTRIGNGAPPRVVAPYGTVGLTVTGRGGVPATGVAAVVVNVTATDTKTHGFVTVYPSGTAQPTASNLNYTGGQSVPNLVTVKVGSDGGISLTNNSAGTTHLIADVAGYYLAGDVTVPGGFVSTEPARILDTRSGHGAARVPSFGTVGLQVTGNGGIPETGVSAVVVNVTATGPATGGFITVYPSGTAQPTASNLNFTAGQSVPNLVTVKVGGDGRINLTNNSGGAVDLLADVAGYYLSGTPTAPGAFVSVDPARVLDTRIGTGAAQMPVPAFEWVGLQVTDRGGIPTPGVAAVIANVTVTGSTGSGFVTVHPFGTAQPTASNLNFTAGQSVPNLAVVKVGGNGRIELANNSTGTTHLIADVAGYFLADPGELAEVWPTGWMFDDCGTEWDGLLFLASPGLVYRSPGTLYFFEGEYFYEFLPDANSVAELTVSAAPGYVLALDASSGWVVNGDGSVTGSFEFTDDACASARVAPNAGETSRIVSAPSTGPVRHAEGPSPLRADD